MHTDVFSALANPIRRDLLGMLRTGPKPVKELAAPFSRGRPAISEHLSILREAGLVTEESRGRENYYHLRTEPLREITDWLSLYTQFWNEKLTNLENLMESR